jgi:hypothetical protein
MYGYVTAYILDTSGIKQDANNIFQYKVNLLM